MTDEPPWAFHDIGVTSGQRKTLVFPEFAADQSERVAGAARSPWSASAAAKLPHGYDTPLTRRFAGGAGPTRGCSPVLFHGR
jgi:hypothetical protein